MPSVLSPVGALSPFSSEQGNPELEQRLARRGTTKTVAPRSEPLSIPSVSPFAQDFSTQTQSTLASGVSATFFAEQQKAAELLAAQQKQIAANQQLWGTTTSPFQSYEGDAQGKRKALLDAAMKYIGTPYSWGGGGPGGPTLGTAKGATYPKQATTTVGFDCSGLVQYAYAKAGIKMPRVSYGQLKQGGRTSINNLQPGDLVGFGNGGHIAIYMGNGKIIESPSTFKNVRVRKLTPADYKRAWGVHIVM